MSGQPPPGTWGAWAPIDAASRIAAPMVLRFELLRRPPRPPWPGILLALAEAWEAHPPLRGSRGAQEMLQLLRDVARAEAAEAALLIETPFTSWPAVMGSEDSRWAASSLASTVMVLRTTARDGHPERREVQEWTRDALIRAVGALIGADASVIGALDRAMTISHWREPEVLEYAVRAAAEEITAADLLAPGREELLRAVVLAALHRARGA